MRDETEARRSLCLKTDKVTRRSSISPIDERARHCPRSGNLSGHLQWIGFRLHANRLSTMEEETAGWPLWRGGAWLWLGGPDPSHVNQRTIAFFFSFIFSFVVEICRVCRGEGSPEQPLRHPCACAGSIRFVHEDWYVRMGGMKWIVFFYKFGTPRR